MVRRFQCEVSILFCLKRKSPGTPLYPVSTTAPFTFFGFFVSFIIHLIWNYSDFLINRLPTFKFSWLLIKWYRQKRVYCVAHLPCNVMTPCMNARNFEFGLLRESNEVSSGRFLQALLDLWRLKWLFQASHIFLQPSRPVLVSIATIQIAFKT